MSDLQVKIIKESVFKIGFVLAVEGRIVRISVNKNKNHSHIIYKGNIAKNVSVGSYIKIVKGFIEIIGKVEGEYIKEDKYFNKEYDREETRISRTLQVSLFGHFDNDVFKQGIKEMPLIGNECFLLDKEEFNTLHKFYREGNKVIKIGTLTDEPVQEIALSVNKLFASHIGIFGNTGSGKSNTLAKLYTELFELFGSEPKFKSNSKFVIIDFNGEYAGDEMILNKKEVCKLSTKSSQSRRSRYDIDISAIRSLDILSVLLEATEKTQKPFLDRAISNDFIDEPSTFNQKVIISLERAIRETIKKADKLLGVNVVLDILRDVSTLVYYEEYNPVESIIQQIADNLHCHSNGDYYWGASISANYDSTTPIYDTHLKQSIDDLVFIGDELNKIKIKIILNYYHEIIKGYSNSEHIRPLIGRMFKKFKMLEKVINVVDANRQTNQPSNLTVISLRDANLEMKKVLPLIICKYLYDQKKNKDENNLTSLHIIIDEAHNILSTESQRESETWKDYRLETFEEIIKEGRKFGTFLTIASQRPYDISPTIISQLHNYFIHRLINNNDINAIEKTVAYLDKLSFESIPILSVGSCFVAGLALDVPIKVDISLLPSNRQPKSETINLENTWS